ncbi:hypothetical protein [Bacillus litorisediminis]|uniref:hypothetical protein n=1 Tax=Bacillus litorisediminis TaxID=2922713 RepID=UPI001FAD4CD9|nr:hypothetical protein [Bacillus litorisediminis]
MNELTNLKSFKEQNPLLSSVPDKEFQYIDGKWYLSLNGMKQLAFAHKRSDLLKVAMEVEKHASVQK